MFKKVIISILIFLIPSLALAYSGDNSSQEMQRSSQWIGKSTISYSGNVGINSAIPGQALDVQGTVRAIQFIAGTGGITLGGVNNTSWPAGTVWTTTNTNDVTLPNNGNVGIGTSITNAGAALSVMNGNVGIGTWIPTELLQVNGNINARGLNCFKLGNDSLVEICSSATTGGNLNIVTNTTTALASGCNITIVNGQEIHTCLNSTTFTPDFTGTVTYLVVAGGGGGGAGGNTGGGGGGGGFLTGTLSVTSGTPYTITVGAGGTAPGSSSGGNGGNSVFGSITATGGGGGGYNGANGANGGSGGGGGGGNGFTTSGGSASPAGQGFAGGSATSSNSNPAGGGGGAGSVGVNGSGSTSGNGGAGLSSSISGSTVFYAGGGGGGNGGVGGNGGGGNGGTVQNGLTSTPGTANTGGGGGGEWGQGHAGSIGGSGIVIISITQSVASTTATFTTLGNVGISSTAPGALLDVAGTIRSTAFTQRGSVADTFTGNVGIGSSVPGQALDVNGNIRTIGTGQHIFGSDNANYISNSASSSGNLNFYTNSLQRMTILNGGNIGINTLTATSLIKVGGTCQAIGPVGTCWTATGQLGYCSGAAGVCSTCTAC